MYSLKKLLNIKNLIVNIPIIILSISLLIICLISLYHIDIQFQETIYNLSDRINNNISTLISYEFNKHQQDTKLLNLRITNSEATHFKYDSQDSYYSKILESSALISSSILEYISNIKNQKNTNIDVDKMILYKKTKHLKYNDFKKIIYNTIIKFSKQHMVMEDYLKTKPYINNIQYILPSKETLALYRMVDNTISAKFYIKLNQTVSGYELENNNENKDLKTNNSSKVNSIYIKFWIHTNKAFYNYNSIAGGNEYTNIIFNNKINKEIRQDTDYQSILLFNKVKSKYKDILNKKQFSHIIEDIRDNPKVFNKVFHVSRYTKNPSISYDTIVIDNKGKFQATLRISNSIKYITTNILYNIKVNNPNVNALIADKNQKVIGVTQFDQKINSTTSKVVHKKLNKLIRKHLVKVDRNKQLESNSTTQKYDLVTVKNFDFYPYNMVIDQLELEKDLKENDFRLYDKVNIKKIISLKNNKRFSVHISTLYVDDITITICILASLDHLLQRKLQLLYILLFFSIILILGSFVTINKLSYLLIEPLLMIYNTGQHVLSLNFKEIKKMNKMRLSNIYEVRSIYTTSLILFHAIESLNKYLPNSIVKQFLNKNLLQQYSKDESAPNYVKEKGQNKNITIFFSDVENFTMLSEQIGASKLVTLLGNYLGVLSDEISENSGTLDKYIGDAIMAFWGAPKELENHAYKGCITAIKCQQKLKRLRYTKWSSKRHPKFVTRIGLNTGDAIVGNIGSENELLNYTTIGDSVNLASRIEALNKVYGTEILCTSHTRNAITETDIAFRKVDLVSVKGKKEPISLYEVIGFKNEMSSKIKIFKELYEEAFELYLKREFSKSIDVLNKTINIKVDKSVNILIERCKKYILIPPSKSWNGVYEFTTK